jgi:hypothetical protein
MTVDTNVGSRTPIVKAYRSDEYEGGHVYIRLLYSYGVYTANPD